MTANEQKNTAAKKEYRVLFASDTHYLSGENLPNIHHWGGDLPSLPTSR